MEEQATESTNPNKKYLIIAVIASIILAIGIVLMVLRPEQTNTKTNTNANTNSATSTNTNTAEVNTNAGTSVLDPIAKARDVTRVTDIRAIMTALESYKTSNGQYPEKLEDLVTDGELGSIPANPQPNGQTYNYTPIGTSPYQSFDLCYALETNGVENIEAGDHCATPNDITGFM